MRRALLAVALATVGALAAPASAQSRTIVVDPGHGGTDPGGAGSSLVEKDIVLDVGLRLRDLLQTDDADVAGGGDWRVLMTRSTDTFIPLAGRAAYANANGADRFMSIHANAFSDPAANGTETFAAAEGGVSAALRDVVQEEMLAAWRLRDRGVKTASFVVLTETAMPAELHELGFVTNATDAQRLASSADRQSAAVAHLRAIQRHFGLAPYLPDPSVVPSGLVEGVVLDEAGPIADATVRLDDGAPQRTDASGGFALGRITVGEHVIHAEAPGYVSSEVPVTVASGETAVVEITLAVDPDDGGCGGCRTSDGGAAGALLVGLGLVLGRRRRAR